MNAMMDGLLRYSRLGSSDKPIEWIDCNVVLQNVLRSLELQITEAGATIRVGQLPTLLAWPGRIDQVFQNLHLEFY